MCQIPPDPGPPEVHHGRQVWQLLTDLGHGGVTDRQLLALCPPFNGRHRRLQVACHLGRGLGSRVRNAEGMQCERARLQGAPRAVVPLFPAAHLGLPRCHQQRGLWSIMLCVGLLLASSERLLRLLEVLVRVSQVAANGQ